jgi:beta-phosphoglucomutase
MTIKLDRKKLKGIFFDFDGTIIDSQPFHDKALKFAASKFNLSFAPNNIIGYTLHETAKIFLENNDITDPQSIEQFVNYKKSFDEFFLQEVSIYKDSMSFIRQYQNIYQIGIVTGARRILIDQFAKANNLEKVLKPIITVEDSKIHKPYPEPYLEALEVANFNSNEVIAIEDSPVGVESAIRAKIFCIGVGHKFSQKDLSMADLYVNSLFELTLD